MTLPLLKLTAFTELVGTEFEVCDDPTKTFPLKLTNCVEQTRTERSEAFSLYFHGPADRFIKQGIHKLKHAQLGELELFLVPTAQDNQGFQYEAVFNYMF